MRVPSKADIMSYWALEIEVLPIAIKSTETQSAGIILTALASLLPLAIFSIGEERRSSDKTIDWG